MFEIQCFTVEREKIAPFSLVLLWQIQASKVISLTTQLCLGNSTPGEIVCQCKKVGKKTWFKNNSVYSIHLKQQLIKYR